MTDTPDGRQALNYAYRKPLGAVGVISPWNLPLLLLTWKVAPALAFGSTVIMKPSEVTPSTATLLAEVAHEVGLPGVLDLTHGFGRVRRVNSSPRIPTSTASPSPANLPPAPSCAPRRA